ncbi:mercuric reductase [Alkalibacterium putridalgicola]|uniref:Mercuric reductase n=1 Tax=Alkalibacterium putridalgicola TaxID=426703 RepID=A0A1H7X9H5_9LACT|nr:mercury(II) reductase [Alkalibacterium putridalgicola]GEK90262.1 mercuric reductase [Alkalibacterium putridalgicola]SEM30284.1 mercuric reductase [Alkalibacterium putridalgicola]
MKKYKVSIQGMTCASCENHVTMALENIGAKDIKTNYRQGETEFNLSESVEINSIEKAIEQSNYQIEKIEKIASQSNLILKNEKEYDYDFLIIGSGSAAFSAAIQATKYGAKVGMVERHTIGGTCVNVGCVPSKTLLRAGTINHLAKKNPFHGLNTMAGEVDLKLLVKQKDELVSGMRQEKYIDLIDEYGFDLIEGEAKFVGSDVVEVNGEELKAKRFLIATGATSFIPEIPGIEKIDYLTSTTLLELDEVPERLTVIGSGYIGLELGQLFHNLGSKVTLIQRSERLLKDYDLEVSETVEKALHEQGIQVITGINYEWVEQDGDIKKLTVTKNGKQKTFESDQLLIATGRKPNTEALNLDVAGVKIGINNEIMMNDFGQTSNQHIYSAGDVTLGPQFVYVAAHEGKIVADNAVGGLNRKIDLSVVPGVIFTNPGVGTVGLTEEQANDKGIDVKTSILDLDNVPRALVNHDATGLIKLVINAQNQQIIGVHIVAENAGEVIYAGTLAVKFGLTVEDLTDTMAPYLTMAEGLKLAALGYNNDVSKLSCCAG